MQKEIIQQASAWLQEAEVLIILAGAGMSADSGIPTYRGEDGSWGKWEKDFNRHITDIMTPQFIQENPIYMWKRFSRGYDHVKNIQPHAGYYTLLDWIEKFQLAYFVLTSNVDGQFHKAGFEAARIYEVHGAGGFLQCTRPCWDKVWQSDYSVYHYVEALHAENLPTCPNCGSLVRPNVYIFRDKTFVDTRIKAQKRRYERFLEANQHKSILLLEIGSGPTIKTIRYHTNRLIRKYTAKAIRINLHHPEIPHPHVSLPFSALEALAQIESSLISDD